MKNKDFFKRGATELITVVGAHSLGIKAARKDIKLLKKDLKEANETAELLDEMLDRERAATILLLKRISNGLSPDKKVNKEKLTAEQVKEIVDYSIGELEDL